MAVGDCNRIGSLDMAQVVLSQLHNALFHFVMVFFYFNCCYKEIVLNTVCILYWTLSSAFLSHDSQMRTFPCICKY